MSVIWYIMCSSSNFLRKRAPRSRRKGRKGGAKVLPLTLEKVKPSDLFDAVYILNEDVAGQHWTCSELELSQVRTVKYYLDNYPGLELFTDEWKSKQDKFYPSTEAGLMWFWGDLLAASADYMYSSDEDYDSN
jgi:hypothetical protein